MSLIQGFTRQETLALTDTTSNQLQYLERQKLVIPQRIGKSRKPTVIYSWEQILEIRAIKHLRRKNVSSQMIKKIIKFLDKSGVDESLRDKHLIVINNEVFWVQQDWSDLQQKIPTIVKIAGKDNANIGQYMLLVIPIFSDIVQEVWKAAKNSELIDFESFKERAKVNENKIA
ncbi:MerR family transcriptional regulator [Crocosphaera chwakensis]|uniref:HTH merR-type domain-containing protein n=1 Tax=Crocosphaera chwakensis CCY0110 TaxID=391612 RepID=A3IT96_9CHRO|nr:MerR family transcriptional regulator [Crocosphaera chwakensis]EAZ90281.1 hypothetical protein CY0110_04131 [Crocosphaera chwakensis CCY0110]